MASFFVVISKPDILAPFPSVTVLCVKLVILVISFPLVSFIVKSNSGVLSFCVYVNVFSDIFKYT